MKNENHAGYEYYYIVDELHRKFREKFPEKLTGLEAFLFNALQYIHLVPTPDSEAETESLIRDLKDRPILRAAVCADVDLLLTGDKDFLESSVKNPRIVNILFSKDQRAELLFRVPSVLKSLRQQVKI